MLNEADELSAAGNGYNLASYRYEFRSLELTGYLRAAIIIGAMRLQREILHINDEDDA